MKASINGVEISLIDCFVDKRGSIFTTYPIADTKYPDFVADKFSISKYGTLRGLHGDENTGKLIFCAYGKIQLAIVDARQDSSTFKQVDVFVLETNEESNSIIAIWVPEGCLNGHLVLSDVAVFYYQWTHSYDLSKQLTIRFDDKELQIPWLLDPVIMSDRDLTAKTMKEVF